MENAFQISVHAHDGYGWLTRPVVLIVIALIILTVILSARGITRNKTNIDSTSEPNTEAAEGGARNPLISLPFGIFLFALFAWAGNQALDWPESVNEFPLMATVPGAVLVFFAIIMDLRGTSTELQTHGGVSGALRAASENAVLDRAFQFFGYLLAMIVIMLVIGQKFAIPLFIFMYLVRWGNYNWRLGAYYAIGGWILIVGFYDRTLDLLWYPAWISTWLPEILPAWLPSWIFV